MIRAAYNTAGVVYELGQALTSDKLVNVKLSNGLAFTGAQLNVCALNGGGALTPYLSVRLLLLQIARSSSSR